MPSGGEASFRRGDDGVRALAELGGAAGDKGRPTFRSLSTLRPLLSSPRRDRPELTLRSPRSLFQAPPFRTGERSRRAALYGDERLRGGLKDLERLRRFTGEREPGRGERTWPGLRPGDGERVRGTGEGRVRGRGDKSGVLSRVDGERAEGYERCSGAKS